MSRGHALRVGSIRAATSDGYGTARFLYRKSLPSPLSTARIVWPTRIELTPITMLNQRLGKDSVDHYLEVVQLLVEAYQHCTWDCVGDYTAAA